MTTSHPPERHQSPEESVQGQDTRPQAAHWNPAVALHPSHTRASGGRHSYTMTSGFVIYSSKFGAQEWNKNEQHLSISPQTMAYLAGEHLDLLLLQYYILTLVNNCCFWVICLSTRHSDDNLNSIAGQIVKLHNNARLNYLWMVKHSAR